MTSHHARSQIQNMLRIVAMFLGLCAPAFAQGTLPVALSQQIQSNGSPMAGALPPTFAAGTVSAVQNTYAGSGLTQVNPWPLSADQSGRLPMFYMASGSTHARLTDSSGVVQFDYPAMLVIGGGGGGGGVSTLDTTTIFATGDIKARLTSEAVTGWVKLNGLTIGSATSGATNRANADTQALFLYTWQNCTDAHCPVVGGRGISALADFSANKQITVPDMRSREIAGLDDMGNTPAGRNVAGYIVSGGGDGVTTPMASGGTSTLTLAQANLPAVPPSFS